jgi:hypothetical protein
MPVQLVENSITFQRWILYIRLTHVLKITIGHDDCFLDICWDYSRTVLRRVFRPLADKGEDFKLLNVMIIGCVSMW